MGIEHVDKTLDPTLTGKMDQDELAVTVWMLTHLRPSMKLSDLRVEYYEQLFQRYKQASDRLKDLVGYLVGYLIMINS